ncbi:MAG: DUF4013 domain-containing protein [Methanocorpusculum sp.]|nr:DUF4013 domain-containing protein [Methanocorpusculum sp.]
MAIHFGENFDRSLSYANTAFRSFGGWFVLILLFAAAFCGIALLAAGALCMAFGMLYIVDPAFAANEVALMFASVLPAVSVVMIAVGILLTVVTECFVYGVMMRVFRGGELSLSRPGRLFVEGVLGMLIFFIYMIPYTVVSVLTMFGPLNNMVYLILVGVVVPLVVLIISMIVGINGVIKYAKEGRFSAAFHVKELCRVVSDIGWLRYLGNVLLMSLIVGGAEVILVMVPVVGVVLLVVLLPFLTIFQARFMANLYESVTEEERAEAAEQEI